MHALTAPAPAHRDTAMKGQAASGKLRLRKAKAYVQEWTEKASFNAKAVGAKLAHPFNRDERRMAERARATLSKAAETLRRRKIRAAEEEDMVKAGTRVKD